MKESYFKAIVEAMEDLVYVCGPDFTIFYMNPSMVNYLGRSAVGEKCHEAFFENDVPCPWCRHRDVIVSKKIIRHEITCPADHRIYNVTCIPVLLQDGSEEVSLTILHDITEIREAQRELEERNEQLRHAQKMEALAILAAGVAHDFNNILGSIMGYASLLKGVVTEAPGSQYTELIEQAAIRASKLVDRLMAFSTKGHREKARFDVNECVRGVLDILYQTVHKGIEIKAKLAHDLPKIVANRADVEHAIMNVCLNAIQAIEEVNPDDPKGVVEIETRRLHERDLPKEARKLLPVKQYGDYVAIEIKDTGKGIPVEDHARIFEPFFTTRDYSEATGLGLSMVYGIMESHEGLIGIDSELNRGTSFTLYFPVVSAEEKTDEVPGEDSAPRPLPTIIAHKSTQKILVVDDEALLRDLLKEVLEGKGYVVLTAPNGQAAVDIYKKRKGEIGLVILDMLMPGMSGLEVFRTLKEIDPRAKVIIASGYVDRHKVEQVKREGVLDFIAKPFSVSELVSKVQRYANM